MKYSRLRLIEAVKDWADCEQLTPIADFEVGHILVKIWPSSIGSQSAQSLNVSIIGGYIKWSLLYKKLP